MAQTPSKYGFFQRFNLEDGYNAFLGLEERQQIFAVVGSIVLLIVLIVLPVSCASSKLGKIEAEFEKGRKSRDNFASKIQEYQNLKSRLAAIKKELAGSGQKGSLSTLIEGIGNEVGISSNIDRLKPISLGSNDYFDEEGIDAVFSNISLDQVVNLLYKLEHYEAVPLRIKKMQIKAKYNKRDQLTATLQISTIKLKEEPQEEPPAKEDIKSKSGSKDKAKGEEGE